MKLDPVVRGPVQHAEVAEVFGLAKPLLIRRVVRVVVGPVIEQLPPLAERNVGRNLDTLRRALARRLQVTRKRGEIEEYFVFDVLIEIRHLEVKAARGVVLDPEVVAFAVLLVQGEARSGWKRERAGVVCDLEQARRPETGADAARGI